MGATLPASCERLARRCLQFSLVCDEPREPGLSAQPVAPRPEFFINVEDFLRGRDPILDEGPRRREKRVFGFGGSDL